MTPAEYVPSEDEDGLDTDQVKRLTEALAIRASFGDMDFESAARTMLLVMRDEFLADIRAKALEDAANKVRSYAETPGLAHTYTLGLEDAAGFLDIEAARIREGAGE